MLDEEEDRSILTYLMFIITISSLERIQRVLTMKKFLIFMFAWMAIIFYSGAVFAESDVENSLIIFNY
jgi:hypothetical protein